MILSRHFFIFCSLIGLSSLLPAPAQAAVSAESAFIFNTLLFLMGGFLVMFMAAGFAMLEAGMVRATSVTSILTKNIALYSLAGIMFYLVGYNLMYLDVDGGYMGTFMPWAANDIAALNGAVEAGSYASASDWFFQMVFVATAASVVSGTLAERIRLWPFLLFVIVLTGVIYPIAGAWKWGGGFLDSMGFADFAGSTLVHSVGGWAALAGVLLLGARHGRYAPDGKSHPMPGSNLPLATIGTFILWLGWFGFNGGSQLALGTISDAVSVATIFVNTNMAAAAGVISAMLLTQWRYGKVDLTMALNGALGGLVSITAEPLTPIPGEAMLIGAVGGLIVVIVVPLLDKLKIDDVVGAIPVHLCCGIWGTMVVPLTNPDADLFTQFVGVMVIGMFAFTASAIVWLLIKVTIGLRIRSADERKGPDIAELGMEAYPEFVLSSKY